MQHGDQQMLQKLDGRNPASVVQYYTRLLCDMFGQSTINNSDDDIARTVTAFLVDSHIDSLRVTRLNLCV